MSAMPRVIRIANFRKGFLPDRAAVRRMIRALDRQGPGKIPAGELSLVFTDDAEISRLHDRFLNDPSVTDVITFPGDDEADDPCPFAGEIFVCVDQALREAPKHGLSPHEELSLYLAHGWLHLAGFDDIRDEDRAAMRRAEAVCMELLRSRGLVPTYRFP